jgi:hypothetical protein
MSTYFNNTSSFLCNCFRSKMALSLRHFHSIVDPKFKFSLGTHTTPRDYFKSILGTCCTLKLYVVDVVLGIV